MLTFLSNVRVNCVSSLLSIRYPFGSSSGFSPNFLISSSSGPLKKISALSKVILPESAFIFSKMMKCFPSSTEPESVVSVVGFCESESGSVILTLSEESSFGGSVGCVGTVGVFFAVDKNSA